MSKKLLIYGLAFGSASAALSYVYIAKVVFSSSVPLHLVFVLSEFLLVPAIGIFMFLKAMKAQNPEGFIMGKALFMGFFLSIIIAASVSLLYSYLNQFKPEMIAQLVDLKIAAMKRNPHAKEWTPKEMEEGIKAIRDSYSVSSHFVMQLSWGGARGLFFAAIFAYFMKAKTASSIERSAQASDKSTRTA